MRTAAIILALLAQTNSQGTTDPFPAPIATAGGVTVSFREFASLPDIGGVAARMMLLVDEPGTRRLFVNDMRGPLYSVSYDGKVVRQYIDVNGASSGVSVQSGGRERGVQSFTFHPQFNRSGTRGYGKFYTLTDTSNTTMTPDFRPAGGTRTHDTVLLEWTAKNPAAETYDGGPPRELIRWEQPFANHNGGMITFNPLAGANAADFGLLYVGFADGGSGGDPLEHAQNLNSSFGKILRIDPLGSNSANGKYGIPASNPFAADNNPATLGEIYAYGVRNPQRFAWDPKTGTMFMSDIGQNIVEEVDVVTPRANLGWNDWEGSFRYLGRGGVSPENPRSDSTMVYPVVEYGQLDPLLQSQSAVTLGYVYRQTAIKPLANKLLFGDVPSGEIFYIDADNLPKGGQDAIRRVLLKNGERSGAGQRGPASGASGAGRGAPATNDDNGTAKTLLQIIKETNARQGKMPATRADLHFGQGPDGQIFILNKADGVIRLLVAD